MMNRNSPGRMPTNPMIPLGGGAAPFVGAPQMPPQADPVAIALARRNAVPPVPDPAMQAPPPALPQAPPAMPQALPPQFQGAPQAAGGQAGARFGNGQAGARLAAIRDRFPQGFERAQAWRAGLNGPGPGVGRPMPGNPPPRPRGPRLGGGRG